MFHLSDLFSLYSTRTYDSTDTSNEEKVTVNKEPNKKTGLFQKIINPFTACFGHYTKNSEDSLKPSITLKGPDEISELSYPIFKIAKAVKPAPIIIESNPYSAIHKGLEELKIFWENWTKRYGSIPDEVIFKKEHIPSVEELKLLYKNLLETKNKAGNRASFIPDESGWLVAIKGKSYLILPKLIIGEGGTADKIVAGIDLETGRCVAASIKTYELKDKTNDDAGANVISDDIYTRVYQLSCEEGVGGVLPLRGKIDIEANESNLGIQIVIQDLCHDGNLYDLITIEPSLSFKQKLKIGKDGFQALLKIHKAKLLHGDVSLENFFLDNGHTLLGDFDRTFDINSVLKKPGQFSCLPPEVILQRDLKKYNAKAEVWAFGLVLYTLFSGRRPFIVKKLKEMQKTDPDHKYQFADFSLALPWLSLEDEEETKLTGLLSQMMCALPDERCTLEEAFEMYHEIIRDFEKNPSSEVVFNPPLSPEEGSAG